MLLTPVQDGGYGLAGHAVDSGLSYAAYAALYMAAGLRLVDFNRSCLITNYSAAGAQFGGPVYSN